MKSIFEILKAAIQHHQAGRLKQAEELYHQILQIDPGNTDALHLSGVIAHQEGKHGAAVDLIQKAILNTPGRALFHNNLGLVFDALWKPEDAIDAFQNALQLKPDFAEVYNNLGNVLRDTGQIEEALKKFNQALRIDPDLPGTYNNLGNAMRDRGEINAAINNFNKALQLKPDYAEAYYNLGNTLRDSGEIDAAIEKFNKALQLKPDYAEAFNNLGNTLRDQGQIDAALKKFNEALRIMPDYAEAYINLGNALRDQGLIKEALKKFEQAILLRPDYSEAHCNRSLALLLNGNYLEGWKEYEWRLQKAGWKTTYPQYYEKPRWDGSPFIDKRLFIYDEQGLGDTLQFIRYLPMVKERGGTIIFETIKPLLGLLQDFPGIDELVEQSPDGKPGAEFDLYAPILSLPGIFETMIETIPAEVPYIHADSGKVGYWGSRFKGSGFRAGIVWEGRVQTYEQRKRSCALESFALLAGIPGVQLIGLQKGEGSAQIKGMAKGIVVTNLGEEFVDFTDTAGVIENLDLVISIDTAVAHLAGAMGKPVWVLLPFTPDWRWFLDREDSPWYPTMRLFRQKNPGSWDAVLQHVEEELRKLMRKWRKPER